VIGVVFAIFLVLLVIGVSVPISIGVASLVAMFVLDISPSLVVTKLAAGIDSWTWIAIPLFIVLGGLMNAGGTMRRLVELSDSLFGHFAGGLSHVVVVTNLVLAGMSGSMVADATAVGSLLAPSMKDSGYPKGYVAAIVASAAIMGPMIPPSIILIMVGVSGEISILRLWFGGIGPGLLIGLTLFLVGYFRCRRAGYGLRPKSSWKQRGRVAIRALPALVLPILILGGMRLGLMTATEAGSVGVLYVIFLGFFVYKGLRVPNGIKANFDAAKSTARVMFVVGAAALFGHILSRLGVGEQVKSYMDAMCTGPTMFHFLVLAVFLILGTVVEAGPLVLIFVPILMPTVHAFGIEPVAFGVFFGLVVMVGHLTPPFGVTMYATCEIAGCEITDYARWGWPFLIALVAVCVLLILFPQIVTVWPSTLM
jgi:C4-dicarboxylate transporter DctM subunit